MVNDPKPLKGLKESTKLKDQHSNGRSRKVPTIRIIVFMNNKVLMLSASPQVGDLGVILNLKQIILNQ